MQTSIRTTFITGAIVLGLSGCAATGEQHRADSYNVDAINTQVEAKTIEIVAILPAKVAVDNSANKENAQMAGAIIGALVGAAAGSESNSRYGTAAGGVAGAGVGSAIGSTVEDTTMVDGVQLTYRQEVIEDIETVVDGKRAVETVKHKKTFISAQVGAMCEFKNGVALLVTTVRNETRIQPNNACLASDSAS
ncbi:glycine zipper 2TM domain-containing protein [Alginatibacterium sediminis]|uniref:Glycine zipper 2TM domain-containing protein n=1 Tax=Alginatibacterium sediminis TaxID=2164068 RepID=A0A420EI03_9ALTE|nr:glycine zipper 2TM domain-containing protein [Alginatibacterium sediminis]RKF20371.1 glycine zipper 2TM domain-containing protein [Alginatibacterium sediminis]